MNRSRADQSLIWWQTHYAVLKVAAYVSLNDSLQIIIILLMHASWQSLGQVVYQ